MRSCRPPRRRDRPAAPCRCSWLREPELRQHAELIAAPPPLDEFATAKPADLQPVDADRLPRRLVTHQRTLVGTGEDVGEGDVIVGRRQVRDFDMQLGEAVRISPKKLR